MIYTVTFNPAIDLVVESTLNIGELNRAKTEDYYVGGKGINVSQILKELDCESVATGFVGGFTGRFVTSGMDRLGISNHFVETIGTTRVNVKIVSNNTTTELNLTGVQVTKEKADELKSYLKEKLTREDVLIISGNAANGITVEDYEDLAKIANNKEAMLIIDTNEAYLESLLPYHPFLIKPNIQELAGIFRKTSSIEDHIVELGKNLQKKGATNVLVSNGAKGAILIGEDGVYYGDPVEGITVSAVGAGDSMVAAFICEYLKTKDYKKALELGLAAGGATAFTSGLAKGKEILKYRKDAYVTKQGENN